ncbi:alpha/beta fold hydrolase [Vannielia litorea]|uniref:alpha/beta fold hydrolase n=1 Tax=Vannielia litorea TaxID=1217970 RepID=UPI001BD131A3|nr:alpha/beta hydrolase [Vannielia litorea]MBS8225499.1 alpha/beta hydrolase [Vannielia litorea]
MSPVPGERKTVRNGETVVAYTVLGPSDDAAPTLCLIASTGRGPADFAHLADKLADGGLRVVLPWPRGAGESEGPLEGITFHDLAADAAAALEAEAGPGGAVIVGHAYGCWIARTVAQDRPDLVDGIILLAAGGGKWPDDLSKAIEVAMTPEAPEADRIAALQRGFFAEGHDPRPWLEGWHAELVVAQRAARAATDRDSWWPSGTAPILDIVGLQDPFRAPEARDFYEKEFAPRVELVTVDGASHALPDEKPDEVSARMLGWVKALLPSN